MNTLKSFFFIGCAIFAGFGLSNIVCADENNIVMEKNMNLTSSAMINRRSENVKLQGLIPNETQRGSMSVSGLGHFGLGLNVGELLDTTDSAFFHVKTTGTSATGLFETSASNIFRLVGGDHAVEFFVGDGEGLFLLRKIGINGTTGAQWISAKETGEVGIGGGAETPLAQLHVSTRNVDEDKDLFLVSGSFDGTSLTTGNEHMIVKGNGNVGIGTIEPNTKFQVKDGDVYVETIGSGIILRSEDGSCFRVTVNNDGTFASESLSCP